MPGTKCRPGSGNTECSAERPFVVAVLFIPAASATDEVCRPAAVPSSLESAAKSVGEFDQDSIRILYVGRPAAGPVESLAELEPKPQPLNPADGLVDVIDDKSDVVDVNVLRLEISGADLAQTNIEMIGCTEYAPSGGAIVTLLLELDAEKSGIEAGGSIEVPDRNVDVIHAPCVHRRGRMQSSTRFPSLDVHMGRPGGGTLFAALGGGELCPTHVVGRCHRDPLADNRRLPDVPADIGAIAIFWDEGERNNA